MGLFKHVPNYLSIIILGNKFAFFEDILHDVLIHESYTPELDSGGSEPAIHFHSHIEANLYQNNFFPGRVIKFLPFFAQQLFGFDGGLLLVN